MRNQVDETKRYNGSFFFSSEKMEGEIDYNKSEGRIILTLFKELGQTNAIGNAYKDCELIVGKLITGATVQLFKNRLVHNQSNFMRNQILTFISERVIFSKADDSTTKYNEMNFVLKNAYDWSQLSMFTDDSLFEYKIKETAEEKVRNWFGAKIVFSTYLKNDLQRLPRKEEMEIIQRLSVKIVMQDKKPIDDFISVRDRIVSLISFAIINNADIDEQYLLDYDDYYEYSDKIKDYTKHYLLDSEPQHDNTNINSREYNFTLDQLTEDKDINDELNLLQPVINLYLSLFRYHDMPTEMIFLNMVQALETFHSRFFYENCVDKYQRSIIDRFEKMPNYDKYKRLLWNQTQSDKKISYIILVSRLNDLLIGAGDLFMDFWWDDENYAQSIADTRNYLTHYGKSKESKALNGEKLRDAIYVLRLLLEYNICLKLDIDIHDKVAESLKLHAM